MTPGPDAVSPSLPIPSQAHGFPVAPGHPNRLEIQEEFAVAYDSDETMKTELARVQEQAGYRFVLTQD